MLFDGLNCSHLLLKRNGYTFSGDNSIKIVFVPYQLYGSKFFYRVDSFSEGI